MKEKTIEKQAMKTEKASRLKVIEELEKFAIRRIPPESIGRIMILEKLAEMKKTEKQEKVNK